MNPDGVLLKYLQRKAKFLGEDIFPLSEVYEEFKDMENYSEKILVFGCYEKDSRDNPHFKKSLEILTLLGLCQYEMGTTPPYVKITEAGKHIGESLHLPPLINQYMDEQLKLRDRLSSGI